MPADVLQKLARANPALEVLYLGSNDFLQVSAAACALYFANVISSLSRYRKLRTLSFRSEHNITSEAEAIYNACVQLRHRNISVRVNDVDFI